MKKIVNRKLLGTALSVVMLASVFAGCSSEANNTDKKAAEPVADPNSTASGYPITKTPITLKVWAPINPNATQFISGNAQNEAYMEMEKRTGIRIEWIHPAQGQEKEAFNLMVASGEFPDIIIGASRYSGGEDKGVRDGLFEDLTPYMEKYAPDYYKLVTSDAETKREVTNDEGKFPAFYMIKPIQDPPSRRIMFRQDMLKAVNMDIPKTIDDYERVFKAIKDAKGIAPYVMLPSGLEEQFLGPYGLVQDFYLKDSKTVAFGQSQPEFKQYLTLMNKWFKEGYINKDFAGLKQQQMDALFDSGKASTIVINVVGTYNRGQQLKQEYVSAPYPKLKTGDKVHYQPMEWPSGGQGQETVITTSSKHKVEAVRWLNYGYTKEGSMLLNYGVEGKTYTMVNGVPKYTDYILNNPKLGTENTNYILKAHFAPKLQCRDIECNPNLAKSPASAAIRQKWADDPDVDSALRLPPIRLSSEETDKRAKIMTEVKTYSDEMVLKFILGAEPLSKFDEYQNQLKKLGIDEAVKITQAAYDRNSSKK
ncbi:MAG: extracellular solute-binding protein family 1 [Paenibacillus sp.]|jgi:putative aldouronate transport system substrate-binding protein|nr:extracellular solute-binding protein family 1 [Paenibacillus sp.]